MITAALALDPELDQLTQTIVARFDPERVVLFGSRARGDAHEGSDYDILVVLDTPLSYSDRVRTIREAVAHYPLYTELFVCTPAEFLRRRSDVGTLVYAAVHEGRVLYERPGSTLGVTPPAQVCEVPGELPESLEDWLARVQSDFESMDVLLQSGKPLYDAICFHAHAGVEKLLKCVLIAQHVPPPRTHELPVLLTRCPPHLQNNASVQDACQRLEELWPRSRYPDDKGAPSALEANDAVMAARAVQRAVQAL